MRVFAAVLGAVVLAAGSRSAREARQDPPARPNVLFIFSDDHGTQSVGAYGSRVNRTPSLDRLACEGMIFRNCFVTNALCGPSRAVILTGKYGHLNGFLQNGDRFDGSQVTFPKLLQKVGYQTAIVGKWHLETDPTGFDYWNILIGQGTYYNPRLKSAAGIRRHEGYVTDLITDLALDWLKKGRDASKPFLLMYQHKAPHREWEPSLKHLNLYEDTTVPEPETLFDDYSGRGTAARRQKMRIAEDLTERDLKLQPPSNLTPEQKAVWEAAYGPRNEAFRRANLQGKDLVRWKYQRYAKDYLRCVASMDENIGRVLSYLDESGLAARTIVVYSSDNGWYLGEHGWFDKRFMYEESLRVPLIVRWPGVVRPGSENGDMVSNLDFAPTFLEAAGVPVPADMQGRSLVPLLKGETPADWRRSFYYHYYEFPGPHSVARHYGVRTARHKLIHFYQLGEWELYDLEKDPDEARNVYDDPAYADTVRELQKELDRLRALYRVPEKDPPPAGRR
jgi:arylsulfatase A-like enzyme